MQGHEPLFLIAAAAAAAVAAATDLWKFKVYNALTLPALAGGLLASAWAGGWAGLAESGLGALTGFALLVFFFALGGVGAGDVKLLTALGAWLGPSLTWQVFVASALLAGAYALVLGVLYSGVSATAVDLLMLAERAGRGDIAPRGVAPIAEEASRGDRRRRLVPFAAMTCLGLLAVVAREGAGLRAGADDPAGPTRVAAAPSREGFQP